jgi:hypothetical protein
MTSPSHQALQKLTVQVYSQPNGIKPKNEWAQMKNGCKTARDANPLALKMDIYVKNVNILRNKKGKVMKYTTFCRGIN